MSSRFAGWCIGAALACGAASAVASDGFDAKARDLFHDTYFFHAWNETDHTVDGDDWSLPPWVVAAPYSGIQIKPERVSDEFPGRILHSVRASWRECEREEGTFAFDEVRDAILAAGRGGSCAVRMGLGASVWETRYFKSLKDRTLLRTEIGTAPRWLDAVGIPRIEEKPNTSIPFQVVNMDIYHPEYHRRYIRLVEAFGRSGIPQMKELDICYVHLVSGSRGEEGAGPPEGDPRRPLFEERMRAWTGAFAGVAHKLCLVSNKEEDLVLALRLGMGQRNGFVEHYMLHAPNPGLGQEVDGDGYLVVNEAHPLIGENRASGDENEEYTRIHVDRFGPIETFPHRYRESTLRMLQMRRNFIWAEGGPWLINPPLLHYMALGLGKTVRTAPDAWCYLRESVVRSGRKGSGRSVKNFERWLYQRDAEGARAGATERVDVPPQMFEYDPDHLYDLTARTTRAAEGQTRIRFGVDDAFLSGGPHAVAVKVTYVDRGAAVWRLEYFDAPDRRASREVTCGESGATKTVTWIVKDAHFPGVGVAGADMEILAVQGDAVVRFVRVIKLDPAMVEGVER